MREPEKSETEKCIAEYGRDLYSFCYYLTAAKADADDLYQDTFLKAMEIGIKLSQNPKSFLLSIAVRLWKNKKRKKIKTDCFIYAKDISDVSEDKFREVQSDTPENIAIKNEVNMKIRDAVKNLPDKFREVALLYYMEEKDIRQIAGIIHVAQGTVKSRLYKARKILYSELEGIL